MTEDIRVGISDFNVRVEPEVRAELDIKAILLTSSVVESREPETHIDVVVETVEVKEKKTPVILEINTSGFFPPATPPIIPDPVVSIKQNGVLVGSQGTLNFVAGQNVGIVTSNDIENNMIDITISSTATPSPPQQNNSYFPQGW